MANQNKPITFHVQQMHQKGYSVSQIAALTCLNNQMIEAMLATCPSASKKNIKKPSMLNPAQPKTKQNVLLDPNQNFSSEDYNRLMTRIITFKEKYDACISETILIHAVNTVISVDSYTQLQRKVYRLIHEGQLLALDWHLSYDSLFASEVLESIRQTIDNIIYKKDKVTIKNNQLHFSRKSCSQQFWQVAKLNPFYIKRSISNGNK